MRLFYFKLGITLIGIFFSFSNVAQSYTYPVAGYDTTNTYHPAFIQSSDGKYKLCLGLYTQFRYDLNIRSGIDSQNDSTNQITNGYSVPRTRIFLEGNLTDKFYYHFRTNINGSGKMELFVGYLQWNIKNNMYLRAGRQFMALGREDWMYPENLASIEFSANDFTFAIWNSFGFQFHHKLGKKFRYWLGIGNGAYGGRQPYPAPDNSDMMITARGEYQIVGENWGVYDDMLGRRGQDYGVMLGLGGAFNQRYNQTSEVIYPDHGWQINADLTVTGSGFQWFTQASTTHRYYDDQVLDNQTWGLYSTFGYWFNKKLFSYLRYDYLSKGVNLASENYSSPGVGLSFYPLEWTNRMRVTLEYNHLASKVNNTIVAPDGALGLVQSSYGGQQSIRFQLQFGF